MSWHDDVARGADALERIANSLEKLLPIIQMGAPNPYQEAYDATVNAIRATAATVTPSDDDEYVEEWEDEATVEVLPPRCAHNHQVLRSNGDIGCADCPHVIIPKTGFNANGGPNLPAK